MLDGGKMREFKIRKIEDIKANLRVQIEFKDDGEREFHTYPKGEGWENYINGKPKFIHDICRRIEEKELSTEIDITALKSLEGSVITEKPSTKIETPKGVSVIRK